MKKNYLNIFIIFVCSFLIMLPMFLERYHNGHDTKYHISNVVALKESIINNGIDTKVVGSIANNFGYGTRNFYPPLAHSSVSLIDFLFNNVLYSFKLVHFIILFLSGISLYYLSIRLFKDKKIALISSIIYMTYPYHLSDIYIRDALAECFLFIFIPLIFIGLSYLFEDKKRFYLFFSLGYIGGILSHFTMMIYFTLLLILFFIIYRKRVFNKDILKILILSAITILFITSPFLVSMISHRLLGNYAVFMPNHMAGNLWNNALNPFDFINIFKNFNTNQIKYYIDIIALILLGVTIYKYKKNNDSFIKFILIFTIISFILSTKIFPWDILPGILKMIQFPWRMIVFISIGISLFAPLCLNKCSKRVYLLVICLLMIMSYFNTSFASDEIIDLNTLDYNNGMGYQKEYLPVNTLKNQDYFNDRSYGIIDDTNSSLIVTDNMPKLEFIVNEKSVVELPRLYYLGYVLENELGENIDIYENKYGFIECELESGKYYLNYEGTIYDKIAKVLSIITLICSIGGLLWKK